jgi:hypothetical protein
MPIVSAPLDSKNAPVTRRPGARDAFSAPPPWAGVAQRSPLPATSFLTLGGRSPSEAPLMRTNREKPFPSSRLRDVLRGGLKLTTSGNRNDITPLIEFGHRALKPWVDSEWKSNVKPK